MTKTVKIVSSLLIFTLIFSFCVAAEVPYLSYNKTEWNDSVAAPEAYRPLKQIYGKDIGLTDFQEPTDFYMTDDGMLFVLEKSGRIVQLDEDLQFVRKIDMVVTADGVESPLREPQGIYVTKENIFIADYGNSRALRLTMDGVIEQVYEKPTDSAYTSEIFQPQKILTDNDGMVYILSEGVYQGLVMYTPDGEFVSYFGTAPVQVTLQQIVDRLWKSLLSEEAGNNMATYVPVSFSNMDRDSDGFIYTCSSYTNNDVEQIRKLNYLGKNIYSYVDNFGEEEVVYYHSSELSTKFVDVHIEENGILYALDQTRGRVYTFDQEGRRLFTFGSLGVMSGTFKQAAAIESCRGRVYVLDSQTATITSFVPTDYGQKILDAVLLYNDGLYEESLEPWEQVLSLNANYELAYCGLGEAMMKLGDYEQAVRYFRLGYDRERESKAFSLYREELLRKHTVWILLGLFLLVVVLLIVTSKKFRRWRKARYVEKPIRGGLFGSFQYLSRVMRRPVETFNEMKFRRYQSPLFVGIVLVAFFVVQVLTRQYTGFRFNNNNPDELNVLIQFTSSILLFVLFSIANWAICSIADGEGKILEIATFNAYAIVPYIVFQGISIPISLCMTLEESVFLSWFTLIGTLWSAFLLFQSVRIVQQYSGGKTVIIIVLTLCGICIILFMVLLLFALFQQVFSFANSIYSEVFYCW